MGAVPKDGFVEVSVSDTGIGIAPEDQEKVFEEFRQVGTAAKKVEGTGLGLTFVSEVCRAPRWADLREERDRSGLDVHIHATSAPWRMSSSSLSKTIPQNLKLVRDTLQVKGYQTTRPAPRRSSVKQQVMGCR